jgi:hypothetical protein
VVVQQTSRLQEDERLLFSVGRREDPRPERYAESSFAFLDRVAQPYWARVRDELDRWFEYFPKGKDDKDLRNRFRSGDPGQHCGAWWELYLYTFLTRSGFEVEVHPDLPGSGGHTDFLVRSERGACYVEATTTFSSIQDEHKHPALEAQIMDAIEKVQSETFKISLAFSRIGTNTPPVRTMVLQIQEWLDTLDPDEVLASSVYPSRPFKVRDWELELKAFPLEPEHRGPVKQLIALGPVTVGSVNDTEKLLAALKEKRGKYGSLDEPLLLAVLMPSGFADLPAVEKALFGDAALRYDRSEPRHDRLASGFWISGDGPHAQSVSGVVTGFGILPGRALANRRPRLWPNPWAANPLTVSLQMPQSVGSPEARFEHQGDGETTSPRAVFGLSAEWPGPEAPFIAAPD